MGELTWCNERRLVGGKQVLELSDRMPGELDPGTGAKGTGSEWLMTLKCVNWEG